ncbi:MAG: hypothetical protein JSS51_14595 [Planctomycetes bacterium]|nr:hypothetical protein [Planctomycetota bacterium]
MNDDVFDRAIGKLAAPRWDREPDWRMLQEKIMSTKRFGWRQLLVLGVLAGGCFAAGAASGIAWDRFTFDGIMQLNDGGIAVVQGEAIQREDGVLQMNLDAHGADISSGGTMELTMPDGSRAQLMTKGANQEAGKEYTLPDGRKCWLPEGVDGDKLIKSGKLKVVPLH